MNWAAIWNPLGQLVDREEGSGHQEQGRDDHRGDVVELVDLADRPATAIPNAAKTPQAVTNPKNGTSSMPHVGSRPKKKQTMSGKQPKNPARRASQSISAVTSSSTSTGAARGSRRRSAGTGV
ncbi:MAG: hypothetical protein IPK93_13415 [Solirubrobacterales bacterium]|nr:hypothetical protein [Solirubrobacterales bacterium]